jgi:Domain of unknown function (DUF4389)
VAYPVTFEADYVEQRSRLTTFFRLILVIPHAIVVAFYAIAAGVVVIVAWFALVFTGRWPRGMYDFVAGFFRYATAVHGYFYLLTDEYPPFGPDVDSYPVRLNVAPPQDEYSRLKVLFRIILAIPPYIIAYAMNIVMQVGAFLAWFAIVVLGRQPKGLQDMIVLGLSYQQRAYAYMALLAEDWPPFTDDGQRQVEQQAPSFGALPSTPPAADAPTPATSAEPYAPPEAPPGTPAGPTPPSAPETPPAQPHGDPLGGEATPPAPPATPPAIPPTPDRDENDEPPPGPFGPSSTNP